MLAGVISSRPKSWLLASPLSHYALAARHRHIFSDATFPIKPLLPATTDSTFRRRRFPFNSSSTGLNFSASGVTASVWHAILPAGNSRGNGKQSLKPAGEGSWNVAWDVRPARWLHRPHSAWLLFGICAYLAAPPVEINDTSSESVVADDINTNDNCFNTVSESTTNYRITGVPADGRCLFRAIAHMVCVRNGEDAPDENRQKELADELRAQVVDELLKRRKEIEWFIEGDFEVYVERMEKPYVWGGEPELLMASHVLKTAISVFMLEKSSGKLLNIATYGKEYEHGEKSSIKVLFHGYGHYDILEDI